MLGRLAWRLCVAFRREPSGRPRVDPRASVPGQGDGLGEAVKHPSIGGLAKIHAMKRRLPGFLPFHGSRGLVIEDQPEGRTLAVTGPWTPATEMTSRTRRVCSVA